MSKSCWLAVILPVVFLSLEADAQPTADETTSCGFSTLEELLDTIASRQQLETVRKIRKEIEDEVKNVKPLLVSGSVEINETRLEAVVREIRDEMRNVKDLISSNPDAGQPSKQALVSALVCEYRNLISLLSG